MFLHIDKTNPNITYLTLDDLIPTKQELKSWSDAKIVDGFVSDCQLNLLVKVEYAERIYHLLNSGMVTLGLQKTPIYKIKLPMHVNDVQGKTQVKIIANLELINTEPDSTAGNEIDTHA
jgi:hypothetical protein